jgi:hypothetical protein
MEFAWEQRKAASNEKRIRFFQAPQESLRQTTEASGYHSPRHHGRNYFTQMATELGMPYQNLINLFLRDCAIQKRRPVIQWPEEASK